MNDDPQKAGLATTVERAADRFGESLSTRVALARDRKRAAELAIEARPVIEALLEGLAHAPRVHPEAAELREAMTLASLLGRRAGLLELTPSGALEIVPALVDAVTEAGHPEVSALDAPLRAVCVEGYVAAREERLEEKAARRVADAIDLVPIAPRCFALFVAGEQAADELERVVDETGRTLLERDARALVVHAKRLAAPDRERARRLFAMASTCRMLGVDCVFAGVADRWLRAARDAGVDVEEVRLAPDFSTGLDAALEACGLELRERGGLLSRLVGPRKR